MPSVVFQVVADHGFISKFSDASFWKQYKLYVLREITEKAVEVIRQHAATQWVKPSGGGLDQSWFTRIDQDSEQGFIFNTKPYAYWLNYGVHPHKMVYLLNSWNAKPYIMLPGGRRKDLPAGEKAAIIPLTVNGKKIFRRVTTRQMLDHPSSKPWFHKGIEPKKFFEEGMEEYRANHLQADFEGLTIRVLDLK